MGGLRLFAISTIMDIGIEELYKAFLANYTDEIEQKRFDEIKVGTMFTDEKTGAFYMRAASDANKAMKISGESAGAFYIFEDGDLVITLPNMYKGLEIDLT